jgi:hypothetical protein
LLSDVTLGSIRAQGGRVPGLASNQLPAFGQREWYDLRAHLISFREGKSNHRILFVRYQICGHLFTLTPLRDAFGWRSFVARPERALLIYFGGPSGKKTS